MKILIFGGSGRLGGAFKRQFKSHKIFSPGRDKVDITDWHSLEQALNTYSPNFVINAAAFNDVNEAQGAGKELSMLVNAKAPEIIAKITAKANIPFCHISTDYVFEGDKKEGYVETDAPKPISVYGISKFLGEKAVLENHPQVYLVRTARLYGHQPESPNAKKSFVETVLELAKNSNTFAINSSEVSSPTLVDDLAKHLDQHILTLPKPGIYHIANAGGCSWFEWAREIVKILKLPVKVTPRDPTELKRAALRPAFSVLLSTKIPPMRSWQDALREFLLTHYV